MKRTVAIKTKPSLDQLAMVNHIVQDISVKLLAVKPNCLPYLDVIANSNALDKIMVDKDLAETLFTMAYIINPEAWFGMGYNRRRWLPGECLSVMLERYREMKGRQAPLWRMIWRYVKDVNEGKRKLPKLDEEANSLTATQCDGQAAESAGEDREETRIEVERLMPVF